MKSTKKEVTNSKKRWKFWTLFVVTPIIIVACSSVVIFIFFVKDRISDQPGVEKGLIYANLHKHTEALEEFKKELIKNPRDAKIQYYMGISYFKLKKYEEAESVLTSALQIKPAFTDASIQLVILHLSAAIENRKLAKDESLVLNKLTKAEEICQTLIQTNPTLSRPYTLLAKIHLELGLRDSAIKDFQDALKVDNSNIDTHIALSELYVQNGNIDLAEIQCNQALSNGNLDNNKIQLLLSRIYEHQGKLDAAIACLKQTLEKNPDYLDAHTRLSVLFLKTAQYDSALSEAEHSIKLSSSANIPPIVYFVKGCVFLKNRDYKEAVVMLKKAALKLPSLPEAHYYLALALTKDGRSEEAITELKSSIALDSRYLPAQIRLARLFADKDLNNETLKICKRILEIYPDNIDALQITGSTHLEMQDYKSAEKYFRKIVELKPSFGDINLAYLALSTDQLDKCIKQCEEIISTNPNATKAYDILGIAHVRDGDIDKGIVQFNKSIELNTDSVKTYVNLAKAYILNENNQGAIEALEKTHSINQYNLESMMLLANLYATENEIIKTKNILSDIIETDPDYLPAYKLASLCLLEGETRKSITLYNKALKLDPNSAVLCAGIAVAYQQNNKATSSILYGQKALGLNDDLPALKIIMTNLYTSGGKEAKAEDLIKASPALTSDVKRAYLDFIDLCKQNVDKRNQVTLALNKAIIAKQKGLLHHSIRECKKAVTLLPDNLIPKLLLASIYVSSDKEGEAYALADNQSEAISIFKDIISMDDSSVHARLTLASLLLKQGSEEKAKNIIEKVVEIAPENRVARKLLGTINLRNEPFKTASKEALATYGGSFEEIRNNARVQFEQGDFDNCISYCKKGLEENPSHTQLRNMLGLAFLMKGQLRKAETEFSKIIDINADYIPAYLGLASVTMKRNQPNIANILYQAVLNMDPKTLEAQMGLGNSFYLMGNYQASIDEFKNITDTHSQNVQAYLALARNYLAQRRFELAETMVNKVLDLESENTFAHSLLARIYQHGNNIPEAINQLKTALNINKDFTEAYNLGTLYIHEGNFEKSIDLYKRAVENFPANTQFWCNLSIAYLLHKEYENAKNACSQALTIEPNSIIPSLCMVNVFLSQNEHESANFFLQNIQKLNRSQKNGFLDIIKFSSNNPGLEQSIVNHLSRAIAFTNIQWLEPALLEYKKLTEIVPSNTIAYHAQVDILFEMGEIAKAIKICNGVLDLYPQSSFTHNKLADIYYRNGQAEKAIIEYKKVIAISPNNVSANLNLGVLQELRNSLTEAVNAYKKVIELTPSSPVAYNNLAWLYATKTQNNLDDALKLGEKAKTLAPKNAEIIDTLGWLYYLNGEYEKAVTELKVAVKIAPWNPTIRYHLGAVFYKKGLHQMALTEMERVLKTSKTFPESKKARSIIEEINQQSNEKT